MSRGVEKWAKCSKNQPKMMLFDPIIIGVVHAPIWKLDAVGTGSRGHRVRCNVRGIWGFGRL